MTAKVNGAVLVVGGGIAGIQAALDLADSGYKVYLAERRAAIGGVMAILDKTLGTEGPLKGRAEINSLYKGCGLCVASCRSGAMQLHGFDDTQIMAMIQAA